MIASRTLTRWLLLTGLSLLVAGAVLLLPGQPGRSLPTAEAQCGADASSCKRCHEGEEAYPVNDLGQWHIDHAASDFCALCHGGDKATDDADAAHTGLFDPLGEQGATRCTACHPGDAADRVATYTDLLASFQAPPPPDPAAEPAATVTVVSDDGYDVRNMALAGFAGVLTMLSGIVVWNFEGLGQWLRRSRQEGQDDA